MSVKIGELYALLRIDDQQFNQAEQRAGQKIGGLGEKFKGLIKIAGLAALGITTAFGFELRNAINQTQGLAGEISKLRRETGLTAEQSSRLVFALHHVGLDTAQASVSIGIFAKGLKGISDAETGVMAGGKKMTELLKDLGIAATDAHGDIRPIDDLLAELADKFKSMPDGLEKTALAMQLFGRSGKDMIPLLNQGADGLEELAKQADKLGVTLSAKNLSLVKAYTLSQRDLSGAIAGLRLQFGFALIPAITMFNQALIKAQPPLRRFIEEGLHELGQAVAFIASKVLPPAVALFERFGGVLDAIRPVLAGAGAAIAGVVAGLVLFGPALGTMMPLLVVLGSVLLAAFGAALSPIGLLVIGATALAGVFRGRLMEGARGAADLFQKRLVPAIEKTIAILRGAAAIFKTGFLAGLSGDAATKNVTRLQEVAFKLGQALRALGAEVRAMLPHLKTLWENVREIAQAFARFLVQSGLLAAAFEGIKTIAQVAGAALLLLYQKALKPLIIFISEHKPVLIALAAALGVVLIALFPIPAAILGVILAIGLLRKNWDTIKEKTLEVWNAIAGYVDEKLGAIDEVITAVVKGIVNFWRDNWRLAWQIIKDQFELIKDVVTLYINIVRDVIAIAMALIHGDWSEAWDGVKRLVSDVWDGVQQIVVDALKLLSDTLLFAWEAIKGIATTAWNAIKEAIIGPFRAAKDAIVGIVDEIIRQYNRLPLPDIGGGGDGTPPTPRGTPATSDAFGNPVTGPPVPIETPPPPRRLFGGAVLPSMAYIVGERRAEVFVPRVAGRIEPSVGGYLGGAGGDMMAVLRSIDAKLGGGRTGQQSIYGLTVNARGSVREELAELGFHANRMGD